MGNAIISKHRLEPLELDVPTELRPWVRIAAAKGVISGSEFLVASVHPHSNPVEAEFASDDRVRRHRLEGAGWLWHCDVVFGILNDQFDETSRFIIGGDWNTARAFERSSGLPDAQL